MLVDFGEKKEEALETRLREKKYNSSGADDDDDDDDDDNYYDNEKDKFTLGIRVLEF